MTIGELINPLSTTERTILYFYAIQGDDGHNLYTSPLLNSLGLSQREYTKAVNKLKKSKMVREGYYWGSYTINPPYRVPTLLYMIQNDKGIENSLLNSVFRGNQTITRLYRIIKYAYTEPSDQISISEKLSIEESHPLTPYCKMPWISGALKFLDDEAYVWYIENAIYNTLRDGNPLTAEEIERLCEGSNHSAQAVVRANDVKQFYLYCAFGYSTEKPEESGPWGMTTKAIQLVLNGDYSNALVYFNAALKLLNKINKYKNMYVYSFPQYYLVMAYIHLDNDTSATKLKQFLNKKESEEHDTLIAARCLASTYVNGKRFTDKYSIQRMIGATQNSNQLLGINHFGILLDKYYGTDLYNLEIPMPKFAIMRHELSAYLNLSDAERKELSALYGDKPALTSIHLKKDWEIMMDDVLRAVDELSPTNKMASRVAGQESRLIYVRKYRDVFEPMYQSTLKSGAWSKPRSVQLLKFYEGEIEYMNDADRNIGKAMKPIYYSYDNDSHMAQSFMPYLVGSDRVFQIYNDGTLEPITVEEEPPYIDIRKETKGTGFAVKSNVKLGALKKVVNGCITVADGKLSYKVIPINENERKIYERLLKTEYFPADSELQLQKFLTRLDGVIKVKSPLIDKTAIRTVDGCAMIAVKVVPAGSYSYNIGIFAKPMLEGSTYCVPGSGKNIIYDTIGKEYLRVKRDLKQETANYREIIDQLDSEENSLSDGDYTLTGNIEQVLDLIDYVRTNPDKAIIEWPEGKALNLKTPLSQGAWNVGIKADNGWFDIEGDVKVDDHTVLKMSQLLELIIEEKGRFIRLNDTDFIEIDKKLRRQLERIEALTVKNRNKLQISSFNAALLDEKTLNGAVAIPYDDELTKLQKRIRESEEQTPDTPKKLKATLRPYQTEGFQWLMRLSSWGAGACLADDMGLGKTVQTIAFLLAKASEGPALIVAPASVVPNWRNELERFAPSLNVEILNKVDDRKATIKKLKKRDVLITSYGLLNTEEEPLVAKHWTTVVLDEAHTIKNRETKMSQAAMKLEADYRIALTGTPIQNHLGELWNLFRFINPGLLGTYESFNYKFVRPIAQDNDKDRRRALQRIIKPFMLRRTKSEVIDDLPDKTDIYLPVELSDDEMAMYEAIRKKAVATLEEATTLDVNTLAEITKLRRAACSISLIDNDWIGSNSKIQTFLELVRDFKGDNNRMLVFSQFTSFLEIVRKALDEAGEQYLYLDGSTSMHQREKLVEEFRQGDCPLFLISLKAGGLGLNLTEANYVVHLDPWWNPAIEQQATDRTYRIGQQRNVTVYHLLAKNTIEEKIRRLHQTKRDLSDSLLEGTDMAGKLTVADILALVTDN